MTIREMLEAHPAPTIGDLDALVRCIEACGDSAVVCTSCADADLGEGEVQDLVRCIRRCLDCADVCDATARIVARQTARRQRGSRSAGQLVGGVPRLSCGVRAPRRASRALPRLRPGAQPLRAGMPGPARVDRLRRGPGKAASCGAGSGGRWEDGTGRRPPARRLTLPGAITGRTVHERGGRDLAARLSPQLERDLCHRAVRREPRVAVAAAAQALAAAECRVGRCQRRAAISSPSPVRAAWRRPGATSRRPRRHRKHEADHRAGQRGGRARGRTRGRAIAPPAPAKTVTSTAMPIAPPSWCATLTSPEAAPASLLPTPAMPAVVSGVNAAPMPTPMIRISGTPMPGKNAVSAVDLAEPGHAGWRPGAGRRPAAACRRSAPRRAARRAPARTAQRHRQERQPGLAAATTPRTPCRYWVRKKNIENIPPTASMRAT